MKNNTEKVAREKTRELVKEMLPTMSCIVDEIIHETSDVMKIKKLHKQLGSILETIGRLKEFMSIDSVCRIDTIMRRMTDDSIDVIEADTKVSDFINKYRPGLESIEFISSILVDCCRLKNLNPEELALHLSNYTIDPMDLLNHIKSLQLHLASCSDVIQKEALDMIEHFDIAYDIVNDADDTDFAKIFHTLNTSCEKSIYTNMNTILICELKSIVDGFINGKYDISVARDKSKDIAHKLLATISPESPDLYYKVSVLINVLDNPEYVSSVDAEKQLNRFIEKYDSMLSRMKCMLSEYINSKMMYLTSSEPLPSIEEMNHLLDGMRNVVKNCGTSLADDMLYLAPFVCYASDDSQKKVFALIKKLDDQMNKMIELLGNKK